VDLVGLGEVASEDLRELHAATSRPYVSYFDATRVGKLKFDLGVLYNRNRLFVKDSTSLLDSYGTTTLKIGERLTLLIRDVNIEMHLCLSHWPSRLRLAETDPKRVEIGVALRRWIEHLVQSAKPTPYLVLMGDFNDDPFSPSLSNHLLATRDRSLAKERDYLLYNPFWRRLGESNDHKRRDRGNGICGTHFYRSGSNTRWHTFDQIIVSPAFLLDRELRLNEKLTRIIRVRDLEERLFDKQEIFDHLPIVGVIETRSTK
jgi:hypothetical protein